MNAMNTINDTRPTTISSIQQEQARDRLLVAASRASKLWNEYASIDPYQEVATIAGAKNPWGNPECIIMELNECRKEMALAWKDWHHATEASSSEEEDSSRSAGDTSDKDAQSLFLEMMTETFQDALEQMRILSSSSTANSAVMEAEDLPLDILVDCLQSTIELFTKHEIDEVLGAVDYKGCQEADDESMMKNSSTLTAHQRYQERWDHYMD